MSPYILMQLHESADFLWLYLNNNSNKECLYSALVYVTQSVVIQLNKNILTR